MTAYTGSAQIRRDSADNWTSNDPTLAAGEIGYETDTGFIKIGDGSTIWTSLGYAFVTPTGTQTLTNKTLGATTLGGNINLAGAYGFGFTGVNSTGSSIPKGTPVYLNGGSLSIAPADANGSGTMPCVGVTAAVIADSASGVVITQGFITGLDTSTYATNDPLYVSETAGALTDTAPALSQEVARVTVVNASTGVILVNPREVEAQADGLTSSEAIVTGDLILFGNASDGYDLYARTAANLLLDLGVSGDLGTVSSGTTTLAFSFNRIQRLVNNGAFTLAPPASGEGTIVLEITNGASAGAITTSGFSSVSGDAFDTTNANKFLCSIAVVNGESYLVVNANSGNA